MGNAQGGEFPLDPASLASLVQSEARQILEEPTPVFTPGDRALLIHRVRASV